MTLENVIAYICKHYPVPDELSKARLTKLVYLADWESCVKRDKPLTKIKWYFHNFGPYVDDVINTARDSNMVEVLRTANLYGDPKELIRIKKDAPSVVIDDEDEKILDLVISQTKKYYWNDFIKHVYETYPIASRERYSELDLPNLAKEYKRASFQFSA